MEEALSILWTYARRQPIESNGKTIVTTYHPQSRHLPCQEVLSCFDKGAFRLPQPRKVGHQGLYIKADNKNCNQASKPRKVSPSYPYIAADLHKTPPLMEPPMIRHHVADDNYRDDRERLISSRPPPF